MATVAQVISTDAKAAFDSAVAFLKALPAELGANGAGAEVQANLEKAIDSEVTTVAGPVISEVALPFVNEGFDKAIAALQAQIDDLTAQKAKLTAAPAMPAPAVAAHTGAFE